MRKVRIEGALDLLKRLRRWTIEIVSKAEERMSVKQR